MFQIIINLIAILLIIAGWIFIGSLILARYFAHNGKVYLFGYDYVLISKKAQNEQKAAASSRNSDESS